ncbi:MAG: GDSL-type esterase/lipase family protein [Oscillospiraceae bacterium]|nr:GDSL-type esterase/lipase family protein [Oscillospiraceae bacterium]
MKKIKALLTASIVTLTTLFSSAWCASGVEVRAYDQVNIMPIGDSITFGLGEDGGYRKYLDYALKTKDIEFDMVGPEGSNSASFNYNGQNCQYDGNHAGYSGYTIKQQYPVPSWGENGLLEKLKSKDAVKQAQPDIVLLIIGTNDMTANRNLNDCEQDLHTLIDYLLADMPDDGIVFMGSIPEFTAYGGNEQRVGNYNNTVKKVAESYGENVQFADVHGCLNGMADMSNDNLHPSGAGYEKMGKFWAEVIEDYLSGQNDGPENPEILRSDFENGLSGWQGRGGVSVSATTDEASNGTASAFVSDRTAAWNGISYSLSSKRCPVGTHISVQAKVMQKTDSPVHFKMTMQYDNDGTAVYDTFAQKDAASGNWVTLSCTDYVIKDGSSPVLYIETDTELCDFYLDEVIVMKTDGTVTDQMGDVNSDGEFNVADIILLQKWLLAFPDAELNNWEAADLCEDGTVNSVDFCMMKNKLLLFSKDDD